MPPVNFHNASKFERLHTGRISKRPISSVQFCTHESRMSHACGKFSLRRPKESFALAPSGLGLVTVSWRMTAPTGQAEKASTGKLASREVENETKAEAETEPDKKEDEDKGEDEDEDEDDEDDEEEDDEEEDDEEDDFEAEEAAVLAAAAAAARSRTQRMELPRRRGVATASHLHSHSQAKVQSQSQSQSQSQAAAEEREASELALAIQLSLQEAFGDAGGWRMDGAAAQASGSRDVLPPSAVCSRKAFVVLPKLSDPSEHARVETALSRHFGEFGTVVSCAVRVERRCGFVEWTTPEAAARAIAVPRHFIDELRHPSGSYSFDVLVVPYSQQKGVAPAAHASASPIRPGMMPPLPQGMPPPIWWSMPPPIWPGMPPPIWPGMPPPIWPGMPPPIWPGVPGRGGIPPIWPGKCSRHLWIS